MATQRLDLTKLLLRREMPGPGEPSPGEPAEGPSGPVQVLGEASGQDADRWSLEVQRDVAALQRGGGAWPTMERPRATGGTPYV
jgi:hypothetical protein